MRRLKKTVRKKIDRVSIRIAIERYVWQSTRTVLLLFLGFIFVRFFVVTPATVQGTSMEPNYINKDIFFVNRMLYFIRPPERFEVVQVIDPEHEKLIIKRVIGLPGETVEIRRGHIFIVPSVPLAKAFQPDESSYLKKNEYTRAPGKSGVRRFDIPTDHYFILGDNRKNSIDSRYYGPIHRSRIVGRVMK